MMIDDYDLLLLARLAQIKSALPVLDDLCNGYGQSLIERIEAHLWGGGRIDRPSEEAIKSALADLKRRAA